MGSAGKGGSTSADRRLEQAASEVVAEGKPLRTELFGQQLEALQTGGVGVQLPIVGAAQSQSRQATARALASLTDELTRRGQSRTPFGARITAETQLSGERETDLIPSRVAQAFIAGAPTTGFAGIAPGLSGMGAASGVLAQRDIAKGNQNAQMISSLFEAVGSAAGGGGRCWIAACLYGEGSLKWFAARRYIFEIWKSPIATLVRAVYRRWGQQMSGSRILCEALRPLFDIAARRGFVSLRLG